jgi:hypothetical protein
MRMMIQSSYRRIDILPQQFRSKECII